MVGHAGITSYTQARADMMQIAIKIAIVGLCVFWVVVILSGSLCLSSSRGKIALATIALVIRTLAAIISCIQFGLVGITWYREAQEDGITRMSIMTGLIIMFLALVLSDLSGNFLSSTREEHALAVIALSVCVLAACCAAAPVTLLLGVAGHRSVLAALKEQRHRLHFVGC